MADSGAKGSCFRTLIETGVVKHVNNLYNGHFPIMDFIDGEVSICAAARKKSKSNVPTFMDERANKVTRKWRRMVDKKDEWSDPQRMRNAMALCADQINDILRPDGACCVYGLPSAMAVQLLCCCVAVLLCCCVGVLVCWCVIGVSYKLGSLVFVRMKCKLSMNDL